MKKTKKTNGEAEVQDQVDDQVEVDIDEGQIEDVEQRDDPCEKWKSQALRALADYQNLQNRVASDRVRVRDQAKQEVFESLLPFLDNLDQAQVFIKDAGLKMVRDEFLKTLEQMGLGVLDLVGKEFDPHTAEAIEVVESEQDNIVVEEIARGFVLGDTIIRPAKVKVGKTTS